MYFLVPDLYQWLFYAYHLSSSFYQLLDQSQLQIHRQYWRLERAEASHTPSFNQIPREEK